MNLRFLAVTAAALFSSCNATSTGMLSEQFNLSTIASTDAAQTLSDVQVGSKRSVRGLRIKVDEDNDDENTEEEERTGVNLNKVDDVVDDIATDDLIKLFSGWREKTAKEILSTPSLVSLPSKKFIERLEMYGMYRAMGEKPFLDYYLKLVRVPRVGS
ncbi:hypothetical protein PRNP1_011350 [Phytophthora ramorum]